MVGNRGSPYGLPLLLSPHITMGKVPLSMFSLRREDDRLLGETFIDRYVNWASTQTDAPKQFHTVNACVILSAIMAAKAVLRTSYAEIKPNIWVMILAGTTIVRKSTTMDMALRVLDDVHPDYLMGTDGSPEGLLSELAFRDGKVSLFHRDEITGFIEAAKNKDYQAGLLEALTRLYDGKREKRILRRESIEIKTPRLVILSGGIKSRMEQITDIENIQSGFIPRFIMVSGTTTPDQMREIGPPVEDELGYDPREDILKELFEVVNHWIPTKKTKTVEVGGMTKKVNEPEPDLTMRATPEAWDRIRQMQRDGLTYAMNSHSKEILVPVFQRMGDSLIKVAMLLAGAECRNLITFEDVCSAIAYSDPWLESALDFAQAVEDQPDYNPWEKKAKKILAYIESLHKQGEACTRTQVMRKFHVRAKDVDDLEKTLTARGNVKIVTVMGGKDTRGKAAKGRAEYRFLDGDERGNTLRESGED